jgi:hypothetical protein
MPASLLLQVLVLLFEHMIIYKMYQSLIVGANYTVSFCFRSPDISSMHHDISPDLKVVATKLKENLGVILHIYQFFTSFLDHTALFLFFHFPIFILCR